MPDGSCGSSERITPRKEAVKGENDQKPVRPAAGKLLPGESQAAYLCASRVDQGKDHITPRLTTA
jgi:hypothetical protein